MPELKADIYSSRRVSKAPGVATEFKADIYSSRRILKLLAWKRLQSSEILEIYSVC